MNDNLINLSKLAEMSGLARQTIYNDIKKGVIRPEQAEHTQETLFSIGEVDRYLVKRGLKKMGTKIITIVNHKGGVGKSLIVIDLAHFLSENGYKVLILDNDPQGNVSNYFLYNRKSGRTNRMALLYETEELDEGKIDKTDFDGIDIVSADTQLAEIELKVKSKIRGDDTLRRAMRAPKSQSVLENYDFVLVDNKPDLGTFVFNSMSASHGVLIPTEARPFSIDGVKAILDNVDYTDAKVLGIILNFYRANTNESPKTLEFYKEKYSNYLFNTKLPHTVKLSKGDLDDDLRFKRKDSGYISGDKDIRNLINDLGNEFLDRVKERLS